MTQVPDISVVMGVFNGGRYLRETIDSVLSQTGITLELIIVNDGSTDESERILRQHALADRRVIVIESNNQGLTKSLVQACLIAKGQYIARQDVGDISLANRFRQQKSLLDQDDTIALVSSWTEYCGPDWEFLYLMKGSGQATRPISILSDAHKYPIDGPTHHGSTMFRKHAYDSVGGYRPEFYYGQDWDLWYRLAEVGKFQLVEEPLYRARILPGSISMEQKESQEHIGALSRAASERRRNGASEDNILTTAYTVRPTDSAEQRKREAHALYFIGECLRRNGDDRARTYFKRAIKNSPLFVKPWIRMFQQQLTRINP